MRRRHRRLLPFTRSEDAPTVDGDTIKLPARLTTDGDERRATDRYRLLD
jgi:hypothetical protein